MVNLASMSGTLMSRSLRRCGHMVCLRLPKQVPFATSHKGGRKTGRLPLGFKDTAEYNIEDKQLQTDRNEEKPPYQLVIIRMQSSSVAGRDNHQASLC